MTDLSLVHTVVIPFGLGLVGFVEPCSIGSSLIFIKFVEGKGAGPKLAQVSLFAGTRALFIGLLGMLAAVLGTAFLGFQKGAWMGLGVVYVLIGLLYVIGKAGALMVSMGPSLSRLADLRGSAGLGILFGFNVPACAAPLIFVLLGTAAAGGVAGGTLASGFVSLALFGFAHSLPLVIAALDWFAGLSRRLPLWTGLILIVLGLWSIGFAWFAHIKA
jgi:cytochrome c-type biogenesis protein